MITISYRLLERRICLLAARIGPLEHELCEPAIATHVRRRLWREFYAIEREVEMLAARIEMIRHFNREQKSARHRRRRLRVVEKDQRRLRGK